MCGIAGFTPPGRDAGPLIAAMTATLTHRGPDGEGVWVDDGIVLGHRRLAVIDVTGGAQPRYDPESGDALVFNGEIYGYREHARALRKDGVPLRDDCDTEVLFWLIRRHGVEGALERIDGMFAFAFQEGQNGALWLARDRFGEKPLFHGERDGVFVFASEIKAIQRHPAFRDRAPDLAAIDQYLTYEYLPGTNTGFAGIRKLPPGHLMRLGDGTSEVRPYWRPNVSPADRTLTMEAAVDRLEALLDASIRNRVIADVPVGVFLSGGVDSGLVAAMAARHAPGITAYTVRMPNASYDETPFAVAVADRYGMTHEIIDLTRDEVLDALATVGERLDEPLADSSLLPTYLVCRAARRGVTVALGGDGADELFGGYAPFKAARFSPLAAALPRWFGPVVRGTLDRLPASSRYMSPDFVARQFAQGLGAPSHLQAFLWMAPFTGADRAALWRPEVAPKGDVLAPLTKLMDGAATGTMERLLHLFTVTYLPEDILAKVDRASMMTSLEVRSPYLDRAFAEFALSLPADWKVRGFETKHLLKILAARHLPWEAVYRPKHGFALPLADMLRGALHDRVRATLLDAANPAAGWFNRAVIARYLDDHRAGRRDHRKKIWTLYVLFGVMGRLADGGN